MTDNTLPEALRLADDLEASSHFPGNMRSCNNAAAAELRRQHARIAALEAVGAGGVQALSAAQTLPESFLRDVVMLCNNQGASPESIESFDREDKWIADLWRTANTMLAASPTPPAEQQAAPKAAPGYPITRFNPATGSTETALQMAAVIALRDEQAAPKTEALEQAARLALETLERASDAGFSVECDESIAALRKALEQVTSEAPKQEAQRPWGYAWRQSPFGWGFCSKQAYEQAAGRGEEVAKLYTAPQPATTKAALGERVGTIALIGNGSTTLTAAIAPLLTAPQQAAPKAAPGVGNSGFDHQTAADFLNGKTVSDEAVRKFVQAARWAHDEKAALSAMLLSVRGVLASREAEIALLKKALMEAEAAPQQEAPLTPKGESAASKLRAMAANYPEGHLWDKLDAQACAQGAMEIEALEAMPQQEAQEPVAWQSRTRPVWGNNTRPWSPWEPCTKAQAEDYWKAPLLHDWAYEARALYTAPQPAPAPLSDDVVKDAARLDWLALAGPTSICVVIDRPHDSEVEVATDDVTGYGKTLREALDAAIAAQGGKA